MTSTFSTNKGLEEPASGDYVNAWASPVNANWSAIDVAFGGTTSISVTGITAPITTLTLSQYRSLNIVFTGTMTANLNYQIPTGVGGLWSINNATTGSFTLAFSIVTGNSLILGSGRTLIVSDGVNVSLANPVFTQALFNQFLSTSTLYPQTALETSVGATAINFFYPPMYVDRYATNSSPGATDMAPAFNTAIEVAMVAGGTVHYGSTAPYLLNGPLNLTTSDQPNLPGITIRNDAGPTINAGVGGATLIANHNDHVFDCTGTQGIAFEYVAVRTGVLNPQTCWFLSRNSTGGGAGSHSFLNCTAAGNFTVSVLYDYGAESCKWIGGYYQNTFTSGSAAAGIWTSFNINLLTSSFQTIPTGSVSTIDHQILGGNWINLSTNAQADCWRFDGLSGPFKAFGTWIGCTTETVGGRSLIFVDPANAPTVQVQLYGIEGENAGGVANPNYGILFGAGSSIHTGWTIDGCKLPTQVRAISAQAGITLDNFHIRNVIEVTSNGIQVVTALQFSVVDSVSTILTVPGTSSNNTLIGDSSRWTIGTRSNDNWIDSGTTNKSWSPVLGTVTHGGILTINETRCLFNGNQVDVEFVMTDTVGISASSGQTITGLPAVALRRSAMVLVANEATSAAIGAGFIEAGTNSIRMPAFSVGPNVSVCVSARYFVA
jgi:hypothetical protein